MKVSTIGLIGLLMGLLIGFYEASFEVKQAMTTLKLWTTC